MRSYRQFCALARALDVVGERWSLLIIRELFAGDSRYSDLRDALPGIASNLLADRLRQLQANGVIEAYEAPRPVRATVYRLTTRGRELAPALRELVAWGASLTTAGRGDDAFRTHWLALGLPALFEGAALDDLGALTVVARTGDQPATVQLAAGELTTQIGEPATNDAVVIEGEPDDVLAVLTGTAQQTPPGVTIHGPDDGIRRLHRLAERSRVSGVRRSSA